jgi:hypothetical protein
MFADPSIASAKMEKGEGGTTTDMVKPMCVLVVLKVSLRGNSFL